MAYETLCESEDTHDNENYCTSCSTCHDCLADAEAEDHRVQMVLHKRISELEGAVGSAVKILEGIWDDPVEDVATKYYDSSDIDVLKRIANINLT